MHCLRVTGGDVHPYETVLTTLEQLLQLADATLLDPTVGNKTNVHSTHIPKPGLGGCITAVAGHVSYTGPVLQDQPSGLITTSPVCEPNATGSGKWPAGSTNMITGIQGNRVLDS